mmetsp:Transcript_30029/g.82433  ORF Transcript_30029/g.82433 Transcript_30029/m.82433 type:complete len:212 (-) Transcript_30029:329-964(-)
MQFRSTDAVSSLPCGLSNPTRIPMVRGSHRWRGLAHCQHAPYLARNGRLHRTSAGYFFGYHEFLVQHLETGGAIFASRGPSQGSGVHRARPSGRFERNGCGPESGDCRSRSGVDGFGIIASDGGISRAGRVGIVFGGRISATVSPVRRGIATTRGDRRGGGQRVAICGGRELDRPDGHGAIEGNAPHARLCRPARGGQYFGNHHGALRAGR